jgi:hypothetical protein
MSDVGEGLERDWAPRGAAAAAALWGARRPLTPVPDNGGNARVLLTLTLSQPSEDEEPAYQDYGGAAAAATEVDCMDLDDAIQLMRGLTTAAGGGGQGGGGGGPSRGGEAARGFLKREWIRVALREGGVEA